jgi:small subunit ribosomal protein S3
VGQKTHPKGFRLVTTQKHLSQWCSNKLNYASLISEDYLIREKLESAFKNKLVISEIEISRAENLSEKKEYVNIKVYALKPRVNEIQKQLMSFSNLESNVEKLNNSSKLIVSSDNVKSFTSLSLRQIVFPILREFAKKENKNYNLSFVFIENIFENATLIAKYIVEQLEKRIPYRRAIKQAIKNATYSFVEGLKIQVSGRLNGIDIARSEWKREGKVPLHTLNARIDYAHQEAKTIYGILGVKVWLYNK